VPLLASRRVGARDPGPFAAQLRGLREAASLTQEELAARAGLTAKAIGALERGERRRPYPHTVRALADALALDETGRADLSAAATPSAPAALSPAARQPALVGRRRELGDVVAALTSRETRLLTVTGPGGVGKTRLALEAAPRVAAATGESPVVVELAEVPDAALVMPTVAQVLGLPQTAAHGAFSAVTGFLGSRRRLLLLDNLEHVLPAATDIGRLLDACPGVTVLATSRRCGSAESASFRSRP